MTGWFATVALMAAVAAGCDSPAAPSAIAGTGSVPTAPFRNYGDTVPDVDARGDTCRTWPGCCAVRRPHSHCR